MAVDRADVAGTQAGHACGGGESGVRDESSHWSDKRAFFDLTHETNLRPEEYPHITFASGSRKGKVHFVIVYNLTRFAREKYDHFALRAHLKSLGISLRSATEPIDDTSTGKLMEGVLAAFAPFDNDVRSDRTRAGTAGNATSCARS